MHCIDDLMLHMKVNISSRRDGVSGKRCRYTLVNVYVAVYRFSSIFLKFTKIPKNPICSNSRFWLEKNFIIFGEMFLKLFEQLYKTPYVFNWFRQSSKIPWGLCLLSCLLEMRFSVGILWELHLDFMSTAERQLILHWPSSVAWIWPVRERFYNGFDWLRNCSGGWC